MEPNEESEQRRVVVNSPGARREVITERTQRGPRESQLSMGTVALVAILVIGAIAVVFYVVSNRNANESANRNANIEVARQANEAQPPTVVQQTAPPAPVIIQQPALPAPMIIQQPASAAVEDNSLKDDMAMEGAATKMLRNDQDMGAVSIVVSGARAELTGTVNSESTKARAERLVRSVRGVKSVDNKIYVPAA
jgi:BON domain